MLHELKDLRIHITPDDFISDVDEIADGSEPDSRCRCFIEPYGPHQINEAGEANYFTGNRVPYHEHSSGYETFLVDAGSVEIISRSRKAVAKKGDIVHIPPFAPHSIHILEDGTIWRAFHQGLGLFQSIIEERRVRDLHPDIYNAPTFRQDVMAKQHSSVWFDYLLPECADVSASELYLIRPYDFGLSNFEFEGVTLRQKVGRWESGGAKEVWQLLIKSGYTLTILPNNIHPLLFDVFSGSVEVKLDGIGSFKANARDLLHIPKFVAGSITTLEDTVLLDCGCQGYLLRMMDELRVWKVREPEKLQDKDFIRGIMKKYDYFVLFEGF
ncbi:MAG: AraC family ligand binding domain-containing protein [Oscillospiraceae bacterium]|jgi:mannose-6-phosphate isomerase-like protein (cupin superfamily)|nr:AraC family ligand binding domain-containing protein [Oscillospiraceae bacterium]